MTTVGFVVHGGRPAAVETAVTLVRWLRERSVPTRALDDPRLEADESASGAAFADGLDLVVSVGGDGTFLRAAHHAIAVDCPVLGVNVGRLGFLTAVGPVDAAELLGRAIRGEAAVEERLAVVAEPADGSWPPQLGLNEVMVEKYARQRVIRVALSIDSEYVTTLSGDGAIVATPTGSTGYSFSAGGPMVSPSVDCLVVTPVAAHMAFDRAFVIGPGERVTLEVVGEEPGLLSADGRETVHLPVGCRVLVRAAERRARLVRRDRDETFYRRVRERFQLPDER